MRTTGTAGLELIKSFEGCTLSAYKLQGERYYTIGYGHYGADVKAGTVITTEEAERMLRSDLKVFEGYVNNSLYCPVTNSLNQNQFDALVSFTYNCGPGCLKQLCRNRNIADIAQHITAYTSSSSEAYRVGLLRRRNAELALYNRPVTIVEEVEDLTEKETQALIDKAIAAHLSTKSHLSKTDISEINGGYFAQREAATKAEAPSEWSSDARAWAEENGIINGTANGMEYKAPMTREQMVSVLHRYSQMEKEM